jgi:hypothetical protein
MAVADGLSNLLKVNKRPLLKTINLAVIWWMKYVGHILHLWPILKNGLWLDIIVLLDLDPFNQPSPSWKHLSDCTQIIFKILFRNYSTIPHFGVFDSRLQNTSVLQNHWLIRFCCEYSTCSVV